MTENTVTIVGNLTDEPQLRYTSKGRAVVNFTVASTPRVYDKTNGWTDGDPLFLACALWGDAAENVTESLGRGARVIVTGKLKQRTFEARDGGKRTVVECDVVEVGPSLKFATAKVEKSAKRGAVNPKVGSDGWEAGEDEPPF